MIAIFLAHLSRRLTRCAYRMTFKPGFVRLSVCLFVCPCVGVLTLLNINISETSRWIAIKLYLKHHWARGKATLGFGADRFGNLVSMATENSHRVIVGKTVLPLFLGCF